jgi:TatA/E family protein of Tat protein translocase
MWEGLLRPTHLLVILALAVLFFGPKRFPEFGRVLGHGWKGLRSMLQSRDDPPNKGPEDDEGRSSIRRVKALLRDSTENDENR